MENGMNVSVDLRVAELLASRLCHDLVGPIGAVSNGMELMADEEFGMADDALALATNSASQATQLLQFYRLAYGMAGSRQGSDLTPLADLATGYLLHKKAQLDWPSDQRPGDLPDGAGKLLLNMIALGVEALPRGGTIGVSAANGPGCSLEVKAVGSDAALREDAASSLAESVQVDDLSPRNVHGYFTRVVAQRLGATLQVEQVGPGFVRISAELPG